MNSLPSASFEVSPTSLSTGETLILDPSATTDLEDAFEALRFRWDWEGDGAWDTDYGTQPQWEVSFDEEGTYMILMEVLDTNGDTSYASQIVRVEEPFADRAQKDQQTKSSGWNTIETIAAAVILLSVVAIIGILMIKRRSLQDNKAGQESLRPGINYSYSDSTSNQMNVMNYGQMQTELRACNNCGAFIQLASANRPLTQICPYCNFQNTFL